MVYWRVVVPLAFTLSLIARPASSAQDAPIPCIYQYCADSRQMNWPGIVGQLTAEMAKAQAALASLESRRVSTTDPNYFFWQSQVNLARTHLTQTQLELSQAMGEQAHLASQLANRSRNRRDVPAPATPITPSPGPEPDLLFEKSKAELLQRLRSEEPRPSADLSVPLPPAAKSSRVKAPAKDIGARVNQIVDDLALNEDGLLKFQMTNNQYRLTTPDEIGRPSLAVQQRQAEYRRLETAMMEFFKTEADRLKRAKEQRGLIDQALAPAGTGDVVFDMIVDREFQNHVRDAADLMRTQLSPSIALELRSAYVEALVGDNARGRSELERARQAAIEQLRKNSDPASATLLKAMSDDEPFTQVVLRAVLR